MNRRMKMVTIVFVDCSIIIFASLISNLYLSSIIILSKKHMILALAVRLVLYILLGIIFNVFNRINRYTSLNSLVSIFFSLTLATLGEVVLTDFSLSINFFDILQSIYSYFIALLLIIGSRIGWRLVVEYRNNTSNTDDYKNKKMFIVGAGSGGELLYNTLKNSKDKTHIEIVGFIDDDKDKYNAILCGKKVLGAILDLPTLVKKYGIDIITVAIPSMTPNEYERLLAVVSPLNIKIYSMPSIEELATGKITFTKLRKIDVVDLLGRDEVDLDMDSIKKQLANKVILITGAGGSIGSEICRQVMLFSPKQLLLVDHGENSIYLIERELCQKYRDKNTEIVPIIADIRDLKRINEVIKQFQPEIIYHAAAHKHVPLMEYNPTEALKNNVFGTKNVAEAALANDVQSFVMISTDKAVNPPNVMGATKRMAEMIVTGLNGKGVTKFSAVRFGNVLGSSGSVIPLFKTQIAEGGPLTVTDFRMTRYFMTIPEASRLVIQSGALAKGGEIFILDMGKPVKIHDLAKTVIKLSGYTEQDIGIIETGMRPGEKLYEELLVSKEKANEQVYEKIFVGNVKGFSYDEVVEKMENLPEDPKVLAKELVTYANKSSEG